MHPEVLDKYPPPCHPCAVPDDLSSLMDEAARYAQFTMRRDGFLAPLMMAATNEGVLMFSPKRLDDESGKEQFANVVRLITGAYGATAVVLILESWMTRASREEPLDMTPPSESFDREEVITLIGQSTEDHSTRMFPIVHWAMRNSGILVTPSILVRTDFLDALPNCCRRRKWIRPCANWARNS